MKKLSIIPIAFILLSSCSDPTVQADLKDIKEDVKQIRKDHDELKKHYIKLLKDAAKAEASNEEKLEGSSDALN